MIRLSGEKRIEQTPQPAAKCWEDLVDGLLVHAGIADCSCNEIGQDQAGRQWCCEASPWPPLNPEQFAKRFPRFLLEIWLSRLRALRVIVWWCLLDLYTLEATDHFSVSCSYSSHRIRTSYSHTSCTSRIINTASHSITTSCVRWIILGYPTTWSQWIDIDSAKNANKIQQKHFTAMKPLLFRAFSLKSRTFAEQHVARLRGSTESLSRSGMWIQQSRRSDGVRCLEG